MWFKAAAINRRVWLLCVLADTSSHERPLTSSGPRWGCGGQGWGSRGPMWLHPNGASCGYPSNTDYYVVPQLTLMGCYNDFKWFNGSQVGAPNGPFYTPMRIMNGNDSVVKCFCFFRFLSLFSTAAQAVWQVSFCVAIGPQMPRRAGGWLTASLWQPISVFIKRVTVCSIAAVHRADVEWFVYVAG